MHPRIVHPLPAISVYDHWNSHAQYHAQLYMSSGDLNLDWQAYAASTTQAKSSCLNHSQYIVIVAKCSHSVTQLSLLSILRTFISPHTKTLYQ